MSDDYNALRREDFRVRSIFHVDVNSAFLSWSALERIRKDPNAVDLRTIPFAVGGDIETRHGIITAKSIPAKAYQIETGEPVVKALAKCPNLVVVRSDFEAYRRYSSWLMRLLREYTLYVEQASIDEAYMDVTEMGGAGISLAHEIRSRVKAELGFTVNVGVSTNKFLAKTASDFKKPDLVHTLYPDEIQEKLWPMPIGKLHGCGSATAGKLISIGINTIGDAAHTELPLLQSFLGNKMGAYIYERANGIDESEVHYEAREAKSYSNETTTAVDVTASNYEVYAVPILKQLCEKVSGRLRKDGIYGSTVSVAVKTAGFKRHSRQTTLVNSTNDAGIVFSNAQKLMRDLLFSSNGLFAEGEALRLIGVGISNLDNGQNRQMEISDWLVERKQQEKQRKLDEMMNSVRERYGEMAIMKGQHLHQV